MSDNVDKRTATQKIEDLEKVVTMLYQATGQLNQRVESLLQTQSDVTLIKDALKILNKKTEAIIQSASAESGITSEAVSALVVSMNVKEMADQTAAHVANGHLTASDTSGSNSFLVCEELQADGSVANPRIQFRMDSLDAANQELLSGKKVGDVVNFGEDKFSVKILEIYEVVNAPAAPAAEAPAAEAPAASTDAAPTTEASVAAEAPAAPVRLV